MSEAIGYTTWTFPAGFLPLESTGDEPEFTSRDDLCLLNTGPSAATVRLTVYFGDRDPVGDFELSVSARRVRHVPVNNLIDPQAIPLDEPYGIVLRSDLPIVAHLTRTDTRRGALAVSIAAGHPTA